MSTPAHKKIRKSHRSQASELELQVAGILFDLENHSKNLKNALTGFTINGVREFQVNATKTALIVLYPLRYLRKIRKVQKTLVHELERKFTGQSVLFVASRKIQTVSVAGADKIQRSRTMKAVHEDYLSDLVFPAEIVGRRVRQLTDGSKHTKVFLDQRDRRFAGPKVEAFQAAYGKLTGRSIEFGFLANAQLQQVAV